MFQIVINKRILIRNSSASEPDAWPLNPAVEIMYYCKTQGFCYALNCKREV